VEKNGTESNGVVPDQEPVGLLFSGGISSTILLAQLLDQHKWIQPIYVRTQRRGERHELLSVIRLLRAMRCDNLGKLVTLDLPLDDLYSDAPISQQWADDFSPDAIDLDSLPGAMTLLISKAALWCQLRGITRLAVGGPSDIDSAEWQQLATGIGSPELSTDPVRIAWPQAAATRPHLMQESPRQLISLTFSCTAAVEGVHCGKCNRCRRRRLSFRSIHLQDPTRYVNRAPVVCQPG